MDTSKQVFACKLHPRLSTSLLECPDVDEEEDRCLRGRFNFWPGPIRGFGAPDGKAFFCHVTGGRVVSVRLWTLYAFSRNRRLLLPQTWKLSRLHL